MYYGTVILLGAMRRFELRSDGAELCCGRDRGKKLCVARKPSGSTRNGLIADDPNATAIGPVRDPALVLLRILGKSTQMYTWEELCRFSDKGCEYAGSGSPRV